MSNPPRDWTVLSMLEWGTDYFKSKRIPDPRHSIEWLLAEVLDVKRLDLYLKFDRPLSDGELDELRPLVKRRARHEPLQYIIGYTDFMNARIKVNPEVLIPRIETEQLVEIILDDHPDTGDNKKVLDIGTGSGCIPVALKQERPGWELFAIDISEGALAVARENAREQNADITFSQGNIEDWEALDLADQFDIIVSNPPYVLPEEKEALEKQVVEHEPAVALFTDNMSRIYNSIIRYAGQTLPPCGHLYLELHELHAEEIKSLFPAVQWEVTVESDYEKKARFIKAKYTGS
ncbi:peptide chain release factor N(5)-glutamine methyltransferase [Halalkalibaculum sp. DA3122]|uniref:peptide chain release factor N(5)-glutamine methyltransferase n=1 Tax=Halalkalibaculum sp. DA3122 TaxID=3373607 RepID=UPI00375498D5